MEREERIGRLRRWGGSLIGKKRPDEAGKPAGYTVKKTKVHQKGKGARALERMCARGTGVGETLRGKKVDRRKRREHKVLKLYHQREKSSLCEDDGILVRDERT